MVFLEEFCDALTPFIAAVSGLLGGVAAVMVAYTQVKQLQKKPNTDASQVKSQVQVEHVGVEAKPPNTNVPKRRSRKPTKPKGNRLAPITKIFTMAVVYVIPVFFVVFLLGLLAGGGVDVAVPAGLLGGGVTVGIAAYVGSKSARTGKNRTVIVIIVGRAIPVFSVVFLLGLLAGGGVNMSIREHLNFFVGDMYDPSGKMGDEGDVTIDAGAGVDRFVYETAGRGPHHWEWKYINGEINDQPAQFAGVMYLHPPNNWGTESDGGRDLSRVQSVVKWDARSVVGEVYVEFVIGGITWTWDETQRRRIPAPYPDSLPRTSLGTKKLTTDWQSFEARLDRRGLDEKEYFSRVVGGFGWVISWAPNGVRLNEQRNGPDVVKTFHIEIRDIRYERR